MNETKAEEIKVRHGVVDTNLRKSKAQENKLHLQKTHKENALVLKGAVKLLKEQVIEATTRSEAL